jgi:transporter family-2 protein
VSFALGAVLLVVATLVTQRSAAPFVGVAGVPLPVLMAGGCLGAFYVSTAIAAVPRLGTAALAAFVIAGQLITAALIDRFGWLGVEPRELTAGRLVGLVLVLAGALLVRFR